MRNIVKTKNGGENRRMQKKVKNRTVTDKRFQNE